MIHVVVVVVVVVGCLSLSLSLSSLFSLFFFVFVFFVFAFLCRFCAAAKSTKPRAACTQHSSTHKEGRGDLWERERVGDGSSIKEKSVCMVVSEK